VRLYIVSTLAKAWNTLPVCYKRSQEGAPDAFQSAIFWGCEKCLAKSGSEEKRFQAEEIYNYAENTAKRTKTEAMIKYKH
jgi:hypothetical protein